MNHELAGRIVRAIDGSHIGRVIERRCGRYRVQVFDRALWLSEDAIWVTDDDGVTLICDYRGVSRYEVAAPV